MSSLRSRILHLANTQTELRPHLLPLLKDAAPKAPTARSVALRWANSQSVSPPVTRGSEEKVFREWVGDRNLKKFDDALREAVEGWVAAHAAPGVRFRESTAVYKSSPRGTGRKTTYKDPGNRTLIETEVWCETVEKPGPHSWSDPDRVFRAPLYRVAVHSLQITSEHPDMKDKGGPLGGPLAFPAFSKEPQFGWLAAVPGKEKPTYPSVRAFVERQKTWFRQDDPDELSWSSDKYGVRGDTRDTAGQMDLAEAERLKGLLLSHFGSVLRVEVDTDGEWVFLSVGIK